MTDFVPATGVVKHKRQESGPSDVAFMERKDEGGGITRATAVESIIMEGTGSAPT